MATLVQIINFLTTDLLGSLQIMRALKILFRTQNFNLSFFRLEKVFKAAKAHFNKRYEPLLSINKEIIILRKRNYVLHLNSVFFFINTCSVCYCTFLMKKTLVFKCIYGMSTLIIEMKLLVICLLMTVECYKKKSRRKIRTIMLFVSLFMNQTSNKVEVIFKHSQ